MLVNSHITLDDLTNKFYENISKNSNKIYAIDTNELIDDPLILYRLSGNKPPKELLEFIPSANFSPSDPNNIVIPSTVIHELDEIKHNSHKDPLIRHAASIAIDVINYLLENKKEDENIFEGIKMENGAYFFVVPCNEEKFQKEFKNLNSYIKETNDLRILYSLSELKDNLEKRNINKNIILVSEDKGMKLKAEMYVNYKGPKIIIENYYRGKRSEYNKMYSGKIEINLDNEELLKKYILPQRELLEILRDQKSNKFPRARITLDEFIEDFKLDKEMLFPNQIIVYNIPEELKEKYKISDIDKYNRIAPNMEFVVPMINYTLYLKEIEKLKERKLLKKFNSSKEVYENAEKLRNSLVQSLSKIKKSHCSYETIAERINKEFSKYIRATRMLTPDISPEVISPRTILEEIPFYEHIYPKGEQIPYFELLLDRNIPLISVVGEQGVGKSLLALLAGLYYLYNEEVDCISIIRSKKELGGEHMGYLPGTEANKMSPWKRSVWDNLVEIFASKDADITVRKQTQKFVEDLEKKYEMIEFLSPGYLQGRTLHRRYIIVDEFQNFPLSVLKIIIGRVGIDSKIVLLGDPKQIDAIDGISKYNSSIYRITDLRKSPKNYLYGHLSFTEGESNRSGVSTLILSL